MPVAVVMVSRGSHGQVGERCLPVRSGCLSNSPLTPTVSRALEAHLSSLILSNTHVRLVQSFYRWLNKLRLSDWFKILKQNSTCVIGICALMSTQCPVHHTDSVNCSAVWLRVHGSYDRIGESRSFDLPWFGWLSLVFFGEFLSRPLLNKGVRGD